MQLHLNATLWLCAEGASTTNTPLGKGLEDQWLLLDEIIDSKTKFVKSFAYAHRVSQNWNVHLGPNLVL